MRTGQTFPCYLSVSHLLLENKVEVTTKWALGSEALTLVAHLKPQ